MERIEFPNTGEDFSGFDAAEKWCHQNGYCVGRMQGPSPIGLLKGEDIDIAKWRNLSPSERSYLDGTITFDGVPRDATAVVVIR